ncbi:MAG: patatin-like phospholipase family protein [Anaerolineae bacterium]
MKRLGLALSGGGARGMAHVGILQTLDEAGIPITCIAGTSAGSLAGAAYAAGYRGPRLEELARGIRWRDIARPARSRAGLFSFDPLESYLDHLLGDRTFADLEIPYAAIAAEVDTGRTAILREGRLVPAVRASCSVPGLVTPTEINGRRLVDGAIANNLPISVARDLGADAVVAVNLHPRPPEPPRFGQQIALASFLYLLLAAGDDPATADVYLPVPVYGLNSLVRLSKRRELIALGRRVAQDALPAIRATLR